MDSLVEAREDIDEIGGALATEIIPDSNIFDQGLFFFMVSPVLFNLSRTWRRTRESSKIRRKGRYSRSDE